MNEFDIKLQYHHSIIFIYTRNTNEIYKKIQVQEGKASFCRICIFGSCFCWKQIHRKWLSRCFRLYIIGLSKKGFIFILSIFTSCFCAMILSDCQKRHKGKICIEKMHAWIMFPLKQDVWIEHWAGNISQNVVTR